MLISRADVDQDKREDSIYLDKAQINEQLVSLRIFDPLGAELWSQELSTLLPDNRWLTGYLLSFGKEVEVLEPHKVRAQVEDEAKGILKKI